MAENFKDYFKKYTVDVYTDILGNIIGCPVCRTKNALD